MTGQQSLKSSLTLVFDCEHSNLYNGPLTILTNYPPFPPPIFWNLFSCQDE